MDPALAMRAETDSDCSSVCSPAFRYGTTCPRCGGLMVGDFCMDLLNGIGELQISASRCVQCGEVVDPVILRNRRIQRPSSTSSLLASVGTVSNESIQQGRTL